MNSINNKTSGFSLIEMLVGLAIGLIIVAAATTMAVSTLKSQKEITASAKLNQELGAVIAVMSNEIRRAGYRMCDTKAYDCKTVKINEVDQELPFLPDSVGYAYQDVLSINDAGSCIVYRYNANVDAVDNQEEHRGFRLGNEDGNDGIIYTASASGNVSCSKDDNWVPLTNPKVITVTDINFTTEGSKCRNMNIDGGKNWYWVVVDKDEQHLACDPTIDETSATCTNLIEGVTTCPSASDWVAIDDDVFATHQINIELEAQLTKDPSVTKKLNTSVKVANPWVGPYN